MLLCFQITQKPCELADLRLYFSAKHLICLFPQQVNQNIFQHINLHCTKILNEKKKKTYTLRSFTAPTLNNLESSNLKINLNRILVIRSRIKIYLL